MSLLADGSRTSVMAIMDALIALNQAEDEAKLMKRLSPRIKSMLETERVKIPVPILAHHDRMRGRGRRSTVAVRHDVCSGCHISIAQGLRSRLRHKLDLNVCENCGSYMYLVEEIIEVAPIFTAPAPVVRKPAKAVKVVVTRRPAPKAVAAPAPKAKAKAPAKKRPRMALAR